MSVNLTTKGTHQTLYSPLSYRDANLNFSITVWERTLGDGEEFLFSTKRVLVRMDRTLRAQLAAVIELRT